MPLPTPTTITATRWRSADALIAIAEDPKASARERRLAAMAVLDLCDQAEAALQAQSAASHGQIATPAPAPQPVPQHPDATNTRLGRKPGFLPPDASTNSVAQLTPTAPSPQSPAHRVGGAGASPHGSPPHSPAQPRAA